MNQDVTLSNAAVASTLLRERRQGNDDVEAYLTARDRPEEVSGRHTGTWKASATRATRAFIWSTFSHSTRDGSGNPTFDDDVVIEA